MAVFIGGADCIASEPVSFLAFNIYKSSGSLKLNQKFREILGGKQKIFFKFFKSVRQCCVEPYFFKLFQLYLNSITR